MNKKEAYFSAISQIIRTGHMITEQVNADLKPLGMTEPQFNVLRILKGQKGNPITVVDIQSRMVQKSSNVTRIIDKLLDKVLVERKECPSNRRKMDITITPKGLTLVDELSERLETYHTSYVENITEEEAMTIARLIKKLKGE
ncbi:MAG: MarR family transcriptional regulator [Reichenbachiella sp.]